MMDEVHKHGLEYLSWLYTTVFMIFSLRMYCTACSDSRIKSATPVLVVLTLIWRLSDHTMDRFERDPVAAKNRPRIALETGHHIIVAANVFGTLLIFGDLLWCFAQQLWRANVT